MPSEKRRFTRIPFNVGAELKTDKIYRSDKILNLSVGGCLLPVDRHFEPGTQCSVRIYMLGAMSELSVEVKGVVVRCGEGTVAVKFTEVSPDSLFHLQHIVLYNSIDTDLIEEELERHPGLL